MAVNVTGTPATLTMANSIREINGPSGIVVDNDANNDANTVTYPQASSLYFSNQGNSTCGRPLRCDHRCGLRRQGDAIRSELGVEALRAETRAGAPANRAALLRKRSGPCACGKHVGHHLGIHLVTLSYESKAPDSRNVRED
jgi:hypothetical protein